MSKKDEFKLSDDLENNLDLFLEKMDDGDFDFDLGMEEDERQPLSFENIKKATAKEFKKPPKLSEIGKALEDTLPQELSPEYDILKQSYDTASKEFSKNFEALKKDMVPITGAIEKMSEKFLGQDNKLKKILQHLKPEEEYNRRSGPNLEEEVQAVLQATLGGQEEIQSKINSMNQAMEERRTKSTNDLLAGIQNDTSLTRLMATDFTAPYQRKSLELQYRSNFYLKELLEGSRTAHKEQLEMLKGIAKNTGLPDVVKQRTMEMFRADMKQQFRSQVMDRFVTNNPLLTNIKTNISNTISGTFNQLRDAASNLAMGVEVAGDAGDDIDKNQMAAMQAKEMAMKGGFMGINKMLMGNKTVKKGLSKFKTLFDNPQSAFSNAKDSIKGDGYVSNILRSVLGVGERLTKNPIKPSKLDTNRLDLDSAASLDVRTKLAVNKVIPGYLRKIHAEIKAARLKYDGDDVKKFELSYSHAQEKFVEAGSLGSLLKKNIADKMQHETSSRIDRLSSRLKRTKSGVDDEKVEEISKYLAMVSTKTSETGMSFLNSKEAKEVMPEHLREDYEKLVSAANKKSEEDLDFIDDMRMSINNVRNSIPSVNKFFQELMKNGDMDVLVDLGIVTYDSLNDQFIPNEANILKIMFETYGITDEKAIESATGEVKENASKLGRMIKRDIVKGKKKFREVKKALSGDEDAREKLKNEVKTMADGLVQDLEKLGDKTKEVYGKTVEKGKQAYQKTEEKVRDGYINASDKVAKFRAKDNKELEKIMKDYKEMKESIKEALSGSSKGEPINTSGGKNEYFQKTEEEKEIETFDTLVREKEKEYKALKLIDTAVESNSNEAIKQVKEMLLSKGMDKLPIVSKKIKEMDKYVAMKDKMGKEALKNIDPKKDPEGANRSIMGLMKSGLNMIPFGKAIGLLGKSTWWLIKRGWKNEAWLAKNLYFPALKGIVKSPLTAAKGLWGGAKLGGKGIGAASKFAFGTGRKTARAAGSLFLNSLSRLTTGKNMIGDTLFGGKKDKKDKKENKGKQSLKEKLINGMTKEEYEKKKGRKRKKKPGIFKQLLGMLMKVGSGLLGAVGGLAGKVGLLAMKALPALASGIASIGGKIAGFFKGKPDVDPKNPNKTPDADGKGKDAKPKADPKKGGGGKKKGLIDKVVDTIKNLKDKILKPIAKKVGPKAAMRVVGKIAAKLGSMIVPGLGWASLLWSLGAIGIMIAKGKSIISAVMLELIGFDPFDDSSQVLDENGNPVKPDEEDLKKAQEENKDVKKEEQKEAQETKKDQDKKAKETEKPKPEKKSTYPANAEEMIQYGIRPARDVELSGMSDADIQDFRKEEQFELKVKKADAGVGTLTESEKTRRIYLSKLKMDNYYVRGDNQLLVELGRKADEMASSKFGDKYTAFKPEPTSPMQMMVNKAEEIKNQQQQKNQQPAPVERDEDAIREQNRAQQAKINEEAMKKFEAEQKKKEEEKKKSTARSDEEEEAIREKQRAEQAKINAQAEAEQKKKEKAAKEAEELKKKKELEAELEEERLREQRRKEQAKINAEAEAKYNKEKSKANQGNIVPRDEDEIRRRRQAEQAKINAKAEAEYNKQNKQAQQGPQDNLTDQEKAILYGDTLSDQVNKLNSSVKFSSTGKSAHGKTTKGGNNEYTNDKKSTGKIFKSVMDNVNEIGAALSRKSTQTNNNLQKVLSIKPDNSQLIENNDKNAKTMAKIGNSTNEHLSELVELNKQLVGLMSKNNIPNPTKSPTISNVPKPVTNLKRSLTKSL